MLSLFLNSKTSFQMLSFLRRYYYTPVKSCSNGTYIYIYICNLNEKYLKVMLNCFLISIDCFYRRIWHLCHGENLWILGFSILSPRFFWCPQIDHGLFFQLFQPQKNPHAAAFFVRVWTKGTSHTCRWRIAGVSFGEESTKTPKSCSHSKLNIEIHPI